MKRIKKKGKKDKGELKEERTKEKKGKNSTGLTEKKNKKTKEIWKLFLSNTFLLSTPFSFSPSILRFFFFFEKPEKILVAVVKKKKKNFSRSTPMVWKSSGNFARLSSNLRWSFFDAQFYFISLFSKHFSSPPLHSPVIFMLKKK